METRSFTSIDAAVHTLACLSMEKQAVRVVREKQAKDSWLQGMLQWAHEHPEAAGSLLGAGGGGLFGALSSLGKDKEERNTLGSTLTGAMGGGLLGLGGGLMYNPKNRKALSRMFTGGREPAPKNWDEVIKRNIESGELPSMRDPNVALTLKERLTGEHGTTPAESLDRKNKLKGMTMPEALKALKRKEITEGEYNTFLSGQNIPKGGGRSDASWLQKLVGIGKPKHEVPQWADITGTGKLTGEQLEGRQKGYDKERDRVFKRDQPPAWDPWALGGVGALDAGHSALRRRLEALNPRNVQQGSRTALDALREGGATVEMPTLKPGGPAVSASALESIGQANQFRWMQNPANQAALENAMKEARKGIAGKGIGAMMKDTHPTLRGGALAAEQQAVIARLREAGLQGRADLGGYVGTLEKLRGKMPAPGVKSPMGKNPQMKRPFGAAPGRRMMGRGLLYGLAPLALGAFKRTQYQYDPANRTVEKVLGPNYKKPPMSPLGN